MIKRVTIDNKVNNEQNKSKRGVIMRATKIKEGIYWVGGIDWSVRNFHGYTTGRGTTYGAYLILDEKITLIDTVKPEFTDEMMERIRDVIDPGKIDYVIANHVEMDHSGGIPAIQKACPNATILTSGPSGVKGLAAHYGEYPYQGVKGGDTLSIGKRTLSFIMTPMLHWPDNMVTYCPEEKILFSNDAFGQHFASSERFDDETELSIVLEEGKKYYGNIIMCYGKQASMAWKAVNELDIDMIAPSHGVIWRSYVKDILKAYKTWSDNKPDRGALVVYDSMWHSTETMAVTIAEAFRNQGIFAKLYDLKSNHNSEIIPEILTSKYVAVGSPTLNNQMLPTVASFLCYLKGLSPKDRKAFAFGSYGWSGQSIKMVEEELKTCGFDICMEAQRQIYVPTKEQLEQLEKRVEQMVSCN